MKIAQAKAIRRKEHVPEELRTDDKDKAALWIDNHVIAKDRWNEMNMTEIADKTGYSRQHIRNTIQDYYELLDEKPRNSRQAAQVDSPSSASSTEVSIGGSDITIHIPADADRPSYVRGWLDCYMSLTNSS